MKKIELHGKYGKGKFTLVDDEDYEELNKYRWNVMKTGYVVRCKYTGDYKSETLLLHSVIMNTPQGMDTDHINHDKLDNRKSNLRIVSRSQNNWNGSKKRTGKSGYKGVSFYKRYNKWQSRIWKNWKVYHLGYFDTAEEAAEAYNRAAKKLHEVYRNPNVIKKADLPKELRKLGI